jgi:hypothetical protein|tara:strand:+ start:8322 stop:8480 length:159 start_codon:yes stop_codon:yes gene_type:complete
MKFFRIAAEKDGLLIANDNDGNGDHHAEDQEEANITRGSRISRRNKLKHLYY